MGCRAGLAAAAAVCLGLFFISGARAASGDYCKEMGTILASNPDPGSSGFKAAWEAKGYDLACVPWLQTACHSPFQLDSPAYKNKYIPQQEEARLSPLTDAIYGDNCQKWQALLDTGNLAELERIMGRLPVQAEDQRINPEQRKMVLQALSYWQLINEKRDHDLRVIVKKFDELEKSGMPGIKNFSGKETGEAVDAMLAHVERALRGEDAKDRAIALDYINGNLRNARSGLVSQMQRHAASQKPGQTSFDLLVGRSGMVHLDEKSREFGSLTPYHAKMILLYRLENAQREKFEKDYEAGKDPKNDKAAWVRAKTDQAMSDLVKEMKIYTVYDPPKGENVELWARSVPHDGFLFSSYPDQTYELLDHSRRKTRNSGKLPVYGSGIDCTTFLQMTIAGVYGDKYAGLSAQERLNSFKIFNSWNNLAIKNVAKAYTLTPGGTEPGAISPANILPGDALVAGTPGADPNDYGHGTMVLGVLNNPGPPGLAILSLRGGYNRSILLEKVYPYRNAPFRCNQIDIYGGDSRTSYKVLKFGKH